MPTWVEAPSWLRPRWLLWAVLAVLALDVRAVLHLRDELPGCASGSLPPEPTSLGSSVRLDQPTHRSGQDVRATVRLVNRGTRGVAVVGVQAVVVAPAGREVVGWAEPVRDLGLVVAPGEYGDVQVTAHLARCPGRPETALPAGWYELVVVVVEPDRRSRSVARPIVVAP